MAVIRADPDPLRPGVSALSAALSIVGIARPTPRPVTANQPETNAVPLAADVAVPTASAAAIMANPPAPTVPAPAEGGPADPPRLDRRGRCNPVPVPSC